MTTSRPPSNVPLPHFPPFVVEKRLTWRGRVHGNHWCVIDARGQIIVIEKDQATANDRAKGLNERDKK